MESGTELGLKPSSSAPEYPSLLGSTDLSFHSLSHNRDLALIVHQEIKCFRDVACGCLVGAGDDMPSELTVT